jgi:hypothetical protein
VLASPWPTAVIFAALLGAVLVLCVTAPAYAFALSLLLYSFEGTLKMRLSIEDVPSAVPLGAAALDSAFLASLAALVGADRGRSLAVLWRRLTRVERVCAAFVGAWLVLSVFQIPLGGNLTNGIEGVRLTQFYVSAILGGVVIAARLGADRLASLLLAAIGLAVLYAGFRGITGPTPNEQLFAEQRAFNASFDDLGRNTGSFTGPVGLVSFLVPAALLCLVLAFLRPKQRWTAVGLFALAMTGIVGSFVRTALVAVVAGAALMALLLLGGMRQWRRTVAALALVAIVLGGGYAAARLASEASPVAEWRAVSLADPFSDYSMTKRFEIWGRTLDRSAEEPFGTGMGTVGRATAEGRRTKSTDNSYLKILLEQGPLGAFLFVGGIGGLFVAAAIRLARVGPVDRPLGTAALTGFAGFLVLMVMAEYIEQPGKLLAWTLLGVAVWEASRGAPTRRTA